MRAELEKIAAGSPLWDKRVCGLQVTDLKEHTMEIRCLVSSRNSSESFDLRCLVREKMIAFLRDNYPDAFPRVRLSSTSRLPDAVSSGSSAESPGTQNSNAAALRSV
jgi:hypothetical protein